MPCVSHQVWADGRRSVERSSRWIWNFWMPFMPSRAAKPWRGTLDVPVTNCRNLARSAWSKERKALQNHWIWRWIIKYLFFCPSKHNIYIYTYTYLYLNGAGLVLVVFSVGLQIIDVNSGQARDEQFQLLLSEDGDQPLGNDLIESLKKGCQLLADCTCKTRTIYT